MKKGIAGIDLGTTFSCMAALGPDKKPFIVPDATFRQAVSTPSVIWFGQGGALAGIQAEAILEQHPEAMLWSFFKRSFGKDDPFLFTNGAAWHAEALGALILKKLKNDFLAFTRMPLEAAVVTVPAHFNDRQRKAVKYAADMADIELLAILEEPAAAALHYGAMGAKSSGSEVFFVYDLGGGTFDATVMAFDAHQVKVFAKDGHTELGGKEFDEQVMAMIDAAFFEKHGDEYERSEYAKIQLRRIAEGIKKELSEPNNAFLRKRIMLGGLSCEIIFNRSVFENHIREAIQKTVEISRRCIAESGFSIKEIDAFLLVGGSSQIPLVRQKLIEELGLPPEKIRLHEPERSVAYGAALFSAMQTGDGPAYQLPAEFRGVTGHHVGLRTIEARTGRPQIDTVIRKNMTLPASAKRLYYTHNPEQTHMALEVAQFTERPDDATTIGTLLVGPLPLGRANYQIEVQIETLMDSTLKIRAFDPQNGDSFSQTFSSQPEESEIMLRQKTLVRSTPVNGIL